MTEPLGPAILEEVAQERWWRYRCGETSPQYPIRCRRDLNHPSPHVGQFGDTVVWPGEGNSVSAQTTGQRCWCSDDRND